MHSIVEKWFPAADSKLVDARIYNKPVLQVLASKEAGEEVYVDRAFIEIRIKGQGQVSIRPLQEKDIARFPQAWRSYKGEQVEVATGTPIAQLDGIEEGQAAALMARGVMYIEDLANIQPEMIRGITSGVYDLQKKAFAYLGIASPQHAVLSMREQNEALRQENSALQGRLAKLEEMVAAMHMPEPATEDTKEMKEKRPSRRLTLPPQADSSEDDAA